MHHLRSRNNVVLVSIELISLAGIREADKNNFSKLNGMNELQCFVLYKVKGGRGSDYFCLRIKHSSCEQGDEYQAKGKTERRLTRECVWTGPGEAGKWLRTVKTTGTLK